MFWKRNHHVSVFLCEPKAGSNEYNALLYIPSVIQLFCMVFFVARHTILITCMCVPMFLLKSRFLQQNRNITYSYIEQIFANCSERPKPSSVEKTEDERVVQVPNVCPKTNTNAVKFTSQFYEAE